MCPSDLYILLGRASTGTPGINRQGVGAQIGREAGAGDTAGPTLPPGAAGGAPSPSALFADKDATSRSGSFPTSLLYFTEI